MSEWDVAISVSIAVGIAYAVFLTVVQWRAFTTIRRNGRLGDAGTKRLAIQMSVSACLFMIFGLGPVALLGEIPVVALVVALPFVALLQVGAAHFYASWYRLR